MKEAVKPNRNLSEDFRGLRTALVFFYVGFATARNVDWGRWADLVIIGLYFVSFVIQAVAWWFLVERPSRGDR